MRAALPFMLVFAVYIGMEMVAAHRIGYRMDATWSLDQYAAEAVAIEACAEPDPDRLARFHRNFEVLVRRAERELGELEGAGDAETIAAEVAARRAAREAEVTAIIAEAGCEDPRIVTHVKRFAIHARGNAGGPARSS